MKTEPNARFDCVGVETMTRWVKGGGEMRKKKLLMSVVLRTKHAVKTPCDRKELKGPVDSIHLMSVLATRSAPAPAASSPALSPRLFDNAMSSASPDEDVYENHHSHKRRISPLEQDVGGCVGLGLRQNLLHRQSHLARHRFSAPSATDCACIPAERTRKRI